MCRNTHLKNICRFDNANDVNYSEKGERVYGVDFREFLLNENEHRSAQLRSFSL